MISVRLPDGALVEHPDDACARDVALKISEGLARNTVAAEVAGQIVDLNRPLREIAQEQPVDVALLTKKDAKAIGVLRHSAAHVMARAVMRLFQGVGLAFGPTTANGFYYDFDLDSPISQEDFPAIEEEMKKIIKEGEPFERFHLDRAEAVKLCADLDQALKVEHIETGLAEHESLSFYRQGEFVDLCRGPHIPDASLIKAFQLLSVAGSYWKGDASNKQLQRLYGTAFFDKKELKKYLEQVEEAKKRDHRALGKKHGLFHITPEVGGGLIMWLPKGATLRSTLEEFIRKELLARGYQPVYSPQIGRVELYETSGHFPYYRDSQFSPIWMHDAGQLVDVWISRLEKDELSQDQESLLLETARSLGFDGEYEAAKGKDAKIKVLHVWEHRQERYLLRSMNCPHHVQIYKSTPRSYRDLPVRLAEFGTVYRYEQSGELNGLLRVRGFTQDDAHLFCTPEQVEQEFRDTLDLVHFVLESVGLDDYRVQLSGRDPDDKSKYVGEDELWESAEATLEKVLRESGREYTFVPGEAAFYGPKADFMVRDCLGREWQLGTVQLDYNLPRRFELEYIDSDNKPHQPVMIHRAPFGSLERFCGMLIEHFAAAFPLWLAPEQLRVLPLSDKSLDYAGEVEKQLRAAGFRVSTDSRSSKVNAKIRDAQLDLIPYMLVVGPQEAETQSVAVRDRIDGDLGSMPLAEAIDKFSQEVAARTVRQIHKSEFAGVETEGEEGHEY